MKQTSGRKIWVSLGMVLLLFAAFGILGYTGIAGQANAAKAEPKYGGTIVAGTYLISYDPKGFDPGMANYNVDHFTSFFAEKLMSGDWHKGPMGTNEYTFMETEWFPPNALKGCLAESWEWTDPLTLVFKLRKGIKFQNKPPVNGREFTADDVTYCWNRLLASPRVAKKRFEALKSVSKVDKYTVAFKLNSFVGEWRYMFGYGAYNALYPREMVEAGVEDWKNACGTGPYMVHDYIRGNSVTYIKNPDYWDTVTLSGKKYKLPFADKIVLPIIRDASTRLAALRSGKS